MFHDTFSHSDDGELHVAMMVSFMYAYTTNHQMIKGADTQKLGQPPGENRRRN